MTTEDLPFSGRVVLVAFDENTLERARGSYTTLVAFLAREVKPHVTQKASQV